LALLRAWNGVATSSSPFRSLSQGDEDIAAPKPFQRGQWHDALPSVPSSPPPAKISRESPSCFRYLPST
jgi:hypothetical protein